MNSGRLALLWHWASDVAKHIIAIGITSILGALVAFIPELSTRTKLELIAGLVVACACVVYFITSRSAGKREVERLERLLAEADLKLESLKRQQQAAILRGSHELHWFAHAARDLAVKMMAGVEPVSRSRRGPIVPAELLPMLQEMVQHMVNTFQLFVSARVFGAIRELRGQGYETILRVGLVDTLARQATSQPMHKHSKPVAALKDQFQKGDCVLLTGSGEKDWQPLPNDIRGEDLCVLLGAAFSKRLHGATGKFVAIRLEWIICIAADQKGAFDESHKPLMKCFNDIFGLLMNIFLRQYQGGQSEPDKGSGPTDDPASGI